MTTATEIIRRRGASTGHVADRSGDVSIAQRGWERTGALLEALGNPQLAYRTIHVAGSKGKGTVTHFAATLLRIAGGRVGRYTSPHLLDWTERIAVDDVPISPADFAELIEEVDRVMAAREREHPEFGTFNSFELLTAAAFLHFRDVACHWAVVEVGLGGRYDSTNHLSPEVSVITRIEREHAEILGPELANIAWNKAGIIQPMTPVVVARQPEDALAVIEREAAAVGGHLFREGVEWRVEQVGEAIRFAARDHPWIDLPATLPGDHNRSNIGAAIAAVRIAAGDLPADAIAAALESTRIPGRFDRAIDPATGRELILDVAHTPESVQALIETARAVTGHRRFPFIVGILADKPAHDLLAAIEPVASAVVFPEMNNPRAILPADLAGVAASLGLTSDVAPTIAAALDRLPAGPEPVVVTGSFAVVAAALRAIRRYAA